MTESTYDLAKLPIFGAVDKENLAIADLIDAAKAAQDERVCSYMLASDSLVQARPKGIATQYANDERCVGRGKCLGRPIDEVREVEDEHRLHLILGRQVRAARSLNT